VDRQTAIALLPCFVCGDLPAQAAAGIERLLESDPELRALERDLRAVRLECGDLLRQPAPALPPPAVRWSAAAALSAAALVLAVLGWLLLSAPAAGPLEGFAEVAALSAGAPGATWLEETAPEALRRAFLAAGVPPELAMAPELTHLGLSIAGGAVVDGGAVVIYRDAEGREYRCQMVGATPLAATPDRRLRAPRAGLPDVDLYRRGGEALAIWRGGGMLCVFSGEVPAEALAALTLARLWGPLAPEAVSL
jgi:anti-sigma factor RsiW